MSPDNLIAVLICLLTLVSGGVGWLTVRYLKSIDHQLAAHGDQLAGMEISLRVLAERQRTDRQQLARTQKVQDEQAKTLVEHGQMLHRLGGQ